jgi:hypothetical protein
MKYKRKEKSGMRGDTSPTVWFIRFEPGRNSWPEQCSSAWVKKIKLFL